MPSDIPEIFRNDPRSIRSFIFISCSVGPTICESRNGSKSRFHVNRSDGYWCGPRAFLRGPLTVISVCVQWEILPGAQNIPVCDWISRAPEKIRDFVLRMMRGHRCKFLNDAGAERHR